MIVEPINHFVSEEKIIDILKRILKANMNIAVKCIFSCVFLCTSLHLYNAICKMEVSYENRIHCKHLTIYFKKLKSILMQTRIVDFIKYDKS